jgi:signal transduction histidine kinase
VEPQSAAISDNTQTDNNGRGSGSPDQAVQQRIFAEQLRLLYRPALPLAVNVVNALIVAAIVWPVVPHGAVAAWVASMAAAIAGRLLLRQWFWRRSGDAYDGTWARRYAIGTAVTGLLWGSTTVMVLGTDDLAYHMLVGLTAAGMVAGSVGSLTVHLPSFFVFLASITVPVTTMFVAAGDAPHVGLGLMTVVFAVAMIFVARGFNRTLIETLYLRFSNADLVRDLSVARDMAEQANRSNWETLAHLSHELRTPLNAIGGFAEIMRRGLYGALGHTKYVEYARDIGNSTTHLTSLVEQILLYSRGHTGALRLDEAIIDTAAEIESCVQMVTETARGAEIRLTCEIAPELPALVADPVKLRQILLNLLSNAIKFTAPGGQVAIAATVDLMGSVAVRVTDTGIGMDPADLPRVMEPYVQLESAFVRKRWSGVGLGLPIVKRLVELHGGSIKLESELGIGTTAVVRFPPQRAVGDDMAPAKQGD